jgi:hypothetical protein
MKYLFFYLLTLLLLKHTVGMSQQLVPQTLNSAGKSSSNGGILLEYTLGGTLISDISTPTFLLTQDFLQPNGGTTNIPPPINDVQLSGWFSFDNAGTTFVSGNAMIEFTLGEVASITLSSTNTMLTQGILQPDTIQNPNPLTHLQLKLFLQGYYLGSNLMEPVLMNQGQGANSSITDSIDVELRPASSPSIVAASNKVPLSVSGMASCSFPSINGSYYVVIKHRNTLETWSANPIALSSMSIVPVLYDFSTAANKAYGNNMALMGAGVWALYSGELNADENIDLSDITLLEQSIDNFEFGYVATDINGDGNVDLLDNPVLETNVTNFIYSIHP